MLCFWARTLTGLGVSLRCLPTGLSDVVITLSIEHLASSNGTEQMVLLFEDAIDDDLPLSLVDFPFESNKVPNWIFDRGFTSEILRQWMCGYDRTEGSLVLPVHDEGNNIVGWIKRRPQGLFPKYLYGPLGIFKKSKVVFGLNKIDHKKDFICVTEGALDTIWLTQNGLSSVALLGIYLSQRQEKLLSKLTCGEIVLCLDNDSAGQSGTAEIAPRLSKYFVVSKINIPLQYKDVQDVRDQNALMEIIDSRVLF